MNELQLTKATTIKRGFVLVGLILFVFVSIIPLKQDIEEYHVQKKGKWVSVTITVLKDCIGSKTHYFMKFEYGGKEFDKKVRCGFEELHRIGDVIQLKHKQGTNIFLFKDEMKEWEILSSLIIGFISIFLVGYGIKKRIKPN